MCFLQEVSDFIPVDFVDKEISKSTSPTVIYYYKGYCPQTGKLLRLPRTNFTEAIARGLMEHLAKDEMYSLEGKMYGILLVEAEDGKQKILKAFSGLLNGRREVQGWVPPIPGRELVELDESLTLKKLEEIKQEIINLKNIPQRKQYQDYSAEFEQRLQRMNIYHQKCKQTRQEKRLLLNQTFSGEASDMNINVEIEKLNQESRQQGIERKLLKRDRDQVLIPLKELINDADIKIRDLKKQRKQLSRQLQKQMHAAYSLMNFLGRSQTLQQLFPGGLPTGTGECCAPKLLHYAATHHLKPIAMAEFWWGSSEDGDSLGKRVQGSFYGACRERCQPIMGFMLSGIEGDNGLTIVYEDEWLIAVNKPFGLLSVPGRYFHNQDSVVSRLRNRNILKDGAEVQAIHRLDMDTSGILLLAKDVKSYSLIGQQFERREVEKIYQAVLCGSVEKDSGVINLPLWGNPENRPYQEVNWEHGKSCITDFKVIKRVSRNKLVRELSTRNQLIKDPLIKNQSTTNQSITNYSNYTHVEFKPLTGRTHQLRVHAAYEEGLNAPILGDKLYGNTSSTYTNSADRLHLHAKKLRFVHPHLGKELCLEVEDEWGRE